MQESITPMMRQYLDIKAQNKDSILFFRLGDFYEMFFDDAIEATKILHITLTSRGASGGKKVPMCGVPYHAANNYIARLVQSGKKVAICEQTEEATPGKKLVNREITKIITPGTFMAEELLDESVNNYILSLNNSGNGYGLAYADISTGEFRVTEIRDEEELFSEVYKISPSECLVSQTFSRAENFDHFKDANLGTVSVNEDWNFDHVLAVKEIREHFHVDSLEGFGCESLPLAVGAAGALLKYLKATQRSDLDNIDVISTYHASQHMLLDRNSQRHLELIQNQEDMTSGNTLFEVLDFTKTPMGKRKLKRWILNPLLDDKKIRERLDAVGFFYDNSDIRENIREILSKIYDVERLSNKVSLATANAKDINALKVSLENVSDIKNILKRPMPKGLKGLLGKIDTFKDVVRWISGCLEEEAPNTLKEGNLIKKGYDKQVDELKELVSGGKDWLLNLQKSEIERTGINSLKVGYNKVFGYYIEVTKTNLSSIPDNYIRKQTLVNAERFITEELKSYESKIVGAQQRSVDLEYEIFCRLRSKIGKEFDRLKTTAEQLALLDVFSNLADVSVKNHYVCPKINLSSNIYIKEGRHPVLEKILRGKEFVPNDVNMDEEDNRIFIITGSNMAGKSTFIRQIALITIMAQMGCFVPASQAEIGIVDRVFTRVGASDRLYKGMSTFMVEMLETANILNNATNKSLIILDEIGRGTSTFDGVSIAWAVVEYIHHNLKGAKAMFATHYHELTELSQLMQGIRNYHLAVKEWGDEIAFLYKVTEGSCDESFGVHVARLAGMPKTVVLRAREILDNLQKDSFLGNIKNRFSEKDQKTEQQFDFFKDSFMDHPAIEKLKNLEIEGLTPLEALNKLSEIKNDVAGE